MSAPKTSVLLTEPPAAQSESKAVAARGSAALDQWRGLALVLVLISHGFFFTGRVDGIGRIGVNLFFFISGILVFRSLRKESSSPWGKTKSFWWRRLRRLYPALAAYILVVLAAAVFLSRIPNQPDNSEFIDYVRGVPEALGYVTNYVGAHPMAMGHLWSLSCEMQFYIAAPLIFLLGGQSPIRRFWVFGGFTAALLAIGIAYPLRNPAYGAAKYHFEVAVWPMMLGFFCEFKKNWFLQLPRRVVTAAFVFALVSLLASITLMFSGKEMKTLVIGVGCFLLLPCLLGYLFGLPLPGRAGQFLAWIGERTYSIYLWQQPFTICQFLPNWLHPFGAAAAIPVGAAWFHFFEKPFLSVNRSHMLSGEQSRLRGMEPGDNSKGL